MLILKPQGLYCPAGDFFIDPRRGVDHAVVTHAHSDHARRGSRQYYCARSGLTLLKARLGQKISARGYEFREPFEINGVQLSFHPAGHILGSSQVRIEHRGQVWVASGDYKREPDPTCEPFETVPCDVFVTEATFGTPSYTWNKQANLGQQIHDWWTSNAARGMNSVLYAYSLGKAQRVLGVLHEWAIKPIYCDPSVTELNACYSGEGVRLAPTICLSQVRDQEPLSGELFLVPKSFLATEQRRLLGPRFATAFASGWMSGGGRFGRYDHGFVMSDHADWNDLVRTIVESRARRVYVQHRGAGALVKHLRSLGLSAFPEEDLREGTFEQLSFFE